MQTSRRLFFVLGFLTLFGFSAIGLALVYFFQERSITDSFATNIGWHWEVLYGAGYGLAAGFLAWRLVMTPMLQRVKSFFGEIIQSLKLSVIEIVFISICAGVGEEVLFRAGIQPFIGVWFTAIIFVALHGYLNPMNWRMSVYGAFMTVAIAGLGYMTLNIGLVSAITAHMVIDIYLLIALNKVGLQGPTLPPDVEEEEEPIDRPNR